MDSLLQNVRLPESPPRSHRLIPARLADEARSSRCIHIAQRVLLRTILAGALVTSPSVATAGYPDGWTPAEMALAPRYCPDAQGFGYGDAYYNTSPNASKWVAVMGKGFWAVHHYCWATINLHRAQRPSTPAVIREGLRDAAIRDMQYVIKNTDPDFVLLPEIYTKMAEVQLLLKRETDARNSLAKAREIKPDYWPAYVTWAEHLQAQGQKALARKVDEEGLSQAPSSKTLHKMLIDLGGDPKTIRSSEPGTVFTDPSEPVPK